MSARPAVSLAHIFAVACRNFEHDHRLPRRVSCSERHPSPKINQNRLAAPSKHYLTAPDVPRLAFPACLFLATPQHLILRHFKPLFPATTGFAGPVCRSLDDLRSTLGSWWKKASPPLRPNSPPSLPPTRGVWRVVVLDDPVNLMPYVTALRAWHLTATVEPAELLATPAHLRQRARPLVE